MLKLELLIEPAGHILGMIGDDNVGPGPLEAGHGFKHNPLFIDPPSLGCSL